MCSPSSDEIPPSFTEVSTSRPCDWFVGRSPSGQLFTKLYPCSSESDDSEDDDTPKLVSVPSSDDEPPKSPRWLEKIHGLVTPLGRQLNGCVGTIVRVDTAAKRYGVNVGNFGLESIKEENLETILNDLKQRK